MNCELDMDVMFESWAIRSRRARPRPAALLGLLLVGAALLSACEKDPGGAVEPYPAPEFTLQDLNPSSPTYLEQRSLSETRGGVVALYFGSFT
jgi:hypothetical protein